MSEAVKVMVRVRPLNAKEKEQGCKRIVTMNTDRGEVSVINPKEKDAPAKVFAFDSVFDSDCTQRQVYDESVYPIVESVLEGYNGTVFAYGQTGTGKTHTMTGVPTDKELRGIIPNAFQHIFDRISVEQPEADKTHLVRASFLEIYNEEIRDLLGPDPKKKLDLKEHPETGVYVKDLSSFVVKNIPEMEKYMEKGNQNRSVGETKMNAQSSRSHSIFTITIETSCIGPTGEPQVRMGKLHLVDLAGSERQSKTEAEGQRLKEAAKINLSLSALGNVISALVDGKGHVPYRDSKLTRLLQDSLGGNSKTVMLAAIGPADYNHEETISTLRYASRAKKIKNKPRINEDPKDALIRQYQEEIQRLKELLSQQGGIPVDEGVPQTIEEVMENVSGIDAETLNKLKTEKEEEIMKILEEKGVVEQERKRIAEQLKEIHERNERQRREKAELMMKLQAMQQSLLLGGRNLLDESERQQQMLRMQEQELEQQRIKEKQLKIELAQREEESQLDEERYSSLEQESHAKEKKLKKLWSKVQYIKTDIQDIQEEFQVERTDMLETLRDLTKQLKLKMLIINSFIPPEELIRIEQRAELDEDTGEWKIENIHLAGNDIQKKRELIDLDSAGTESNKSDVLMTSENLPNVYFTYSPSKENGYSKGIKTDSPRSSRASSRRSHRSGY